MRLKLISVNPLGKELAISNITLNVIEVLGRPSAELIASSNFCREGCCFSLLRKSTCKSPI